MYFGIKSKQKGGKGRGTNGGGMGGKEKEGEVEDGGGEGCTIVYIVAAHYTFGYRIQRAKPLTILTTTSHDKWMFEFWHHLSVNFLQSGTLKIKIKKN